MNDEGRNEMHCRTFDNAVDPGGSRLDLEKRRTQRVLAPPCGGSGSR